MVWYKAKPARKKIKQKLTQTSGSTSLQNGTPEQREKKHNKRDSEPKVKTKIKVGKSNRYNAHANAELISR